MATVAVILLLLCLRSVVVKGVILILKGDSIPTDGSGLILITDINTNGISNHEALMCQSEPNENFGHGNWSFDNVKIGSTSGVQGWKTEKFRGQGILQVRLVRISYAAEEGMFACHLDETREPAAFVGIYYPIYSTLATIVVVDSGEKTLKVQCNSTGGRALNMSVIGPDGFNFDLNNIQTVGDPQRIGDDGFSAFTDVISGGRDGDIYQCTASNGVSSDLTNSVELRVASTPTITSLEQISATAVRVEWSQPSEGASVTGYIVHYSDGTDGDIDRIESVAASSTSSDITHLTSGVTYTISVEATSQHLSGESDEWTITIELLPRPHGVGVSDVKSISVRVSWQTVEDADILYTVALSQTMGDDQLGLCLEDSHTVVVNTSSLSVVVGQTDGVMLRAYTSYFITVVAENDVWGSSQPSDPVIVTTNQTSTSVPPRNVTAKVVSSTVISVQWDGLTPCSQVNGLIVDYRVQYTAESSGVVQSIDVTGEWNVMKAQTSLTGLAPYTNYSIQVAAVNVQGDVGLFSDPIITQTQEATPGERSTLVNFTWRESTVADNISPTYYAQNTESADNISPSNVQNTKEERSTSFNLSLMTNVESKADSVHIWRILGGGMALLVIIIISVVVSVLYVIKQRHSNNNRQSKRTPEKTSIHSTLSSITNGPLVAREPELQCNTVVATQIISKPVITLFPDDRQVLEGEEVVFRVKVTGVPVPELTWYHNGKELVADYSKDLADDGSLTMPSAETKHCGVYQLVAVNRAGRVEKEVMLCVSQEGEPCLHGPEKQIDFVPIPVEEFGDYVVKCHVNDNKDFVDQFTVVDSETSTVDTTTIGFSRSHKKLNRFGNITVYDHNRIILRPIEGHSDCQRDFINASYIDGYNIKDVFIAAQGPLSRTTIDFWRLVWQERPQAIVMVTNLEEGNQKKCHQYWPETGTQSFGPFRVTITDQQILADYTTRLLLVQLIGSSEHAVNVTQFHFTAWPDHGVPDYATSLLAFHKRLKKHYKSSKGSVLVHCSAGVGRTGTYITIDCVLDQLEKERVVDIAGTIIHLRTQRMKMVQSLEQYMFIHDAILEAITCGDTQINASNFRRSIKNLSYRDPATQLTAFENQFQILEKVSPNPREIQRKKALENPTKNRSDECLPGDRWRVVLRADMPDYIHAVYINGYKQRGAFIIAQSPMLSTVRDFWKMIYDRKCGVIIMLCDLVETGQEVCQQYWPNTGMVEIREYTLDLLGEEKREGFISRTLSICHKKTGKAYQVVQLHMTNWSHGGHCSNLSSITDMIAEMSKIQRRTGNKPIIVHCSDTVSRSGMFCAIATTIEKCKTEGVVDVFQVVKALRVQKPGAVCNVAQYHTVFEAVLVYLDSFDTYSNFRCV